MKRAYSHNSEKKSSDFRQKNLKIYTNTKKNNLVVLTDTENMRNFSSNKANVNNLNKNSLKDNESNFLIKNLKQSENLKSNLSIKGYPIQNFKSNKSGLSRNNSVDRLKLISKYDKDLNNQYNKNSSNQKNKGISSLKSNINNALRNLTNKPKIMSDKLIPSRNMNMFSNIDPSIDQKYNKPSERFQRVKYSDPFATTKKHKTNFGYVYSAGGIPCRIQHGSVKMNLKWDIEPGNLDYDPILVVCFEGLQEVEHPFNFASRQCVREMLQSRGAREKTLPILPKIINPLRNALGTGSDGMFLDNLEITRMLSDLLKENLNPYLHFFLQHINKRAFSLKYKEKVFDFLRKLEENGGEDALKEIKKKIPTYVSLL